MNIHFVLPQVVPTYGMEKAALALMEALAGIGCTVSSCTLSGPAATRSEEDLSLDLEPGTFRLPRSVPRLRRHLSSLPPETHIVASGLWAALPVGCALAGTGRRFVAWEHSVLPVRLQADRRVAGLFRAAGLRPLRPHTVVAVSEGVRRAVLAARPGAAVETIPNIVTAPALLPRPRRPGDGPVTLVTTGALRPLKNTRAAVQALRHLPDSSVLNIAGDGPLLDPLRAEARDLGVAGRVRFLGRVPDVRPLLDEADVLVHPSLVETFGLSLFEAADAGVPVAAFAVEAIDEIVPFYVPGELATERTARSLADAVLRVLDGRADVEPNAAWQRRCADLAPTTVAHRWCDVLAGTPDIRPGLQGTGDRSSC